MKFNNRILRKILIKDSRAESSIVALYKKLELQNAMEILDTVSGDISAAPSIVSLYEEKKSSAKPKKKFLASDLKNMHDILSKNMYKIRQRTVAYTGKHALPNDSHSREILIRRHASIRRSLRPQSFQTSAVPKSHKYFSLPAGKSLDSKLFPPERLSFTDDQETMSEVAYPSRRSRFGQPARSSSRAMMPLRRLDTLKEVPSLDVLNEGRRESGGKGRGMSRTNSSYSESHVPAPRRHFNASADNNNGSADDFRNVHQEEEEEEQEQPSSPPPGWVAERSDNSTTQNPLLRRPQWNPRK
nr:PREDICTED: sodium/hydrogen exchanger 2-like [Paralichthys olivaceus]